MPFEKGNKLQKGRPKGSKNIKTWQKEMFVKYLEEEGAPALLEDLRTLDPKDRVHYMTSLMPYAFAKRAPVDDKGKTAQQVLVLPQELIDKNDTDTSTSGDSL